MVLLRRLLRGPGAWCGIGVPRNETHCQQGHALTEDNIYYETLPGGRHKRRCRQCRRNREHRYNARQRGRYALKPNGSYNYGHPILLVASKVDDTPKLRLLDVLLLNQQEPAPVTHQELHERTLAAKSTIAKVIAQWLDDKVVVEVKRVSNSPLFRINKDHPTVEQFNRLWTVTP